MQRVRILTICIILAMPFTMKQCRLIRGNVEAVPLTMAMPVTNVKKKEEEAVPCTMAMPLTNYEATPLRRQCRLQMLNKKANKWPARRERGPCLVPALHGGVDVHCRDGFLARLGLKKVCGTLDVRPGEGMGAAREDALAHRIQGHATVQGAEAKEPEDWGRGVELQSWGGLIFIYDRDPRSSSLSGNATSRGKRAGAPATLLARDSSSSSTCCSSGDRSF